MWWTFFLSLDLRKGPPELEDLKPLCVKPFQSCFTFCHMFRIIIKSVLATFTEPQCNPKALDTGTVLPLFSIQRLLYLSFTQSCA